MMLIVYYIRYCNKYRYEYWVAKKILLQVGCKAFIRYYKFYLILRVIYSANDPLTPCSRSSSSLNYPIIRAYKSQKL